MGVRWFGCDSFHLLVFISVQIPLLPFWVGFCIHSMTASERISQMSSTWVPLLLLQRQSLRLCGYLSCVFSCLQPEIQMVLLVASQIPLGKLSETGNVSSFSMSLNSTKSVCNCICCSHTSFTIFLNFWVLLLWIACELDLIDHSQERLWGLEWGLPLQSTVHRGVSLISL